MPFSRHNAMNFGLSSRVGGRLETDVHQTRSRPVWTKTADQILAGANRKTASATGH